MLLRHLASNNVLLALSVMHVDFKRKISYIRIFFPIFVRTFINRHGLHGFWTTVGSDRNRGKHEEVLPRLEALSKGPLIKIWN